MDKIHFIFKKLTYFSIKCEKIVLFLKLLNIEIHYAKFNLTTCFNTFKLIIIIIQLKFKVYSIPCIPKELNIFKFLILVLYVLVTLIN